MATPCKPPPPRRRQRGFSAALVLTALVLLGGMLAYAVTATSGMQAGTTQEILQSRARQAAEVGLEWARYHLRFSPAYCPAGGTVAQLTLPLGQDIPVTVTCTPTGTHAEASNTVRTYHLTANACSPAGPGGACPNPAASADYVERQVTGIAER